MHARHRIVTSAELGPLFSQWARETPVFERWGYFAALGTGNAAELRSNGSQFSAHLAGEKISQTQSLTSAALVLLHQIEERGADPEIWFVVDSEAHRHVMRLERSQLEQLAICGGWRVRVPWAPWKRSTPPSTP